VAVFAAAPSSFLAVILSEGGMLLRNLCEPIAVNERQHLCFTFSIVERPYKLGSRVVRIGPAHQVAAEFEKHSITERTVLRQITVGNRRSDARAALSAELLETRRVSSMPEQH
jgi:hypothetical protein